MTEPTVETIVRLAEQLSEEEQAELVQRLKTLHGSRQRPSQTLRVFHADAWPQGMRLRREDEYDDDER